MKNVSKKEEAKGRGGKMLKNIRIPALLCSFWNQQHNKFSNAFIQHPQFTITDSAQSFTSWLYVQTFEFNSFIN
jgi:hypothetical protein